MDHSLNSLNNFDFLARSFARMHAEGRPVDILAVTGNMDEEHRTWPWQGRKLPLPRLALTDKKKRA